MEVEETGESLTDEQLERFEGTLRAVLPGPYRRFLLKSNGGVPCPDTIDVEGAPGSPTDVQVFFGIGRPVKSSDLDWNKRTFADRLPSELLPIACDSGGNLFCITLAGDAAGHVIYVDLEPLQPTHYRVARDFDTFLDKIGSHRPATRDLSQTPCA